MKVRVFTEDKFTIMNLKKVRDIMKKSKCPNESFNASFPERYRGVRVVSKKQINVYFDSMSAKNHIYEIEV